MYRIFNAVEAALAQEWLDAIHDRPRTHTLSTDGIDVRNL